MSVEALKKLVTSSKASVLIAVVVLLAVMLYTGKIDSQQFLDAIKILVPGWMVSRAASAGAKALANGRRNGSVEKDKPED